MRGKVEVAAFPGGCAQHRDRDRAQGIGITGIPSPFLAETQLGSQQISDDPGMGVACFEI